MEWQGRSLGFAEVGRYAGDVAALGGVRLVELADGAERGIRVLEFRTGTGLRFEVLVDRAMDLGAAEHAGRSIGWCSPTGFRHPGLQEHADEDGLGLLRSFSGLCVTVGLDHAFGPADVPADTYGYPGRPRTRQPMHGRVADLPARLVSYGQEWVGDECVLWAEGEVRQAAVFAEHLRLRRRIETHLGSNEILVSDEVVNAGFDATPHMFLYHVNLGWPLLDAGARVLAPIVATPWRSESAAAGAVPYATMREPVAGHVEQVYEHEVAVDAAGRGRAALVNDTLGLGLMLDWDAATLPRLVQWVNLRPGAYVVGLEPSTHGPAGDLAARADGSMLWLQPGESRRYSLRYTVLPDAEACARAEESIRATGPQPTTAVP